MISDTSKISDILLDYPRILLVLEHFEIPLGFGEKTVGTICDEYSLNKHLFLAIANLYCCKEQGSVDIHLFSTVDLRKILSFLKKSHIYFLEEKIPALNALIDAKIKTNPDDKYSLLIKKFLEDYSAEVREHMNYEDEIVFPYVKTLLAKKPQDTSYSMKQFRKHHTDIEVKLADLKNLLIKHVPSEYDSVVRRKLLFELFDLEYEINIHDYIENHLLIPSVEHLENQNYEKR